MATIDDVSDAILSEILSYIDILKRQRLEIVCKRWQLIIRRIWTTQHKLRISVRPESYCSPVHIHRVDYIPGGIACDLQSWDALRAMLKLCAGNIIELRIVVDDEEGERPLDTFESLMQNKNLKSFSILDGYEGVMRDCLSCLPTNSLQEFSAWHENENFDDETITIIEEILTKTPTLTSLEVGKVSLLMLEKIEMMSELKVLKLGPLEFTVAPDDLFLNTILLTNLEELSVSDEGLIDDKFLTELVENCKKLRAIRFLSESVTSDGLQALKMLPNLRCINLSTVEGPQILNYFSNLEDFRCDMFRHGPISEEILTDFLRRSPNLKICYFADESLHRSFKELAAKFGIEIQYKPY